ncbi:MAG: hypothetical protein Q4C81_06170 [Kocuria sp.]|nr:hypothetical protein [Kocuria sp.]
MNWLKTDDDTLVLTLEELQQVDAGAFVMDTPTRVDVVTPHVVLPLLVINRNFPRLLVLNNGAVDLERSQGKPIFQRSSWWEGIESKQIYVCDPRTVGDDALSLPWMQCKPPQWFGPHMVKALKYISIALGVLRPADRTYFGSSAGGFTALMQLGSDRGARAVVNNAQFDWTRWYPQHVKPVLERYFDGRTAAEVRKKWPRRVNSLRYLSNNQSPLRIDYWINMASEIDRKVQMSIFQNFFLEHPELVGKVTVHQYSDQAQLHNPMVKENILEILNDHKEN